MAARDRTRAGQLSFGELEQLWRRAGGSERLAPTMAAIALAESSGRTDALNDDPATGDYSVGPWQINFFGNLYRSRAKRYGTPAQLIADPIRDARAAVDLAGDGSGLGNWSTYKSGAYQRYLAGSAPAIGSRGPRPDGGGGGVTGFLGGVAHGFASPFEAAYGGVTSIVDFLKAAAWLIDPNNWLRMAEFVVGVALMLFGIYFYGSATSSSSPASKNVPIGKIPGLAGPAGAAVKAASKAKSARSKGGGGPRRQGDAAAARGEEVTQAGAPQRRTGGDKVRERRNASRRRSAARSNRRALDKKYGEVPF